MNETSVIVKILKMMVLMVLIIAVGAYAFSQTMQIPLSAPQAERVLESWKLLHGQNSISSWEFSSLELPVSMLCGKLFGLSTFAAIASETIWSVILFCTGLLILRKCGCFHLIDLLIYCAIAALPDPAWMEAVQYAPAFIFCLILFLFYLSKFIDGRGLSSIIGLLISGILMVFSVRIPSVMASSAPVHETLRALQTVFRADFSKKALFQFATVRYFIMTLVLLLMLWVVLRIVVKMLQGSVSRQSISGVELVFAAAILLTIIYSCLPDDKQKEAAA